MFIEKGKPVRAFEVGTWGGEVNAEFGPKEGDVIVKEHWPLQSDDVRGAEKALEPVVVDVNVEVVADQSRRYAVEDLPGDETAI